MATLGTSTTPSTGYFFDDTGNSQWCSSYTMPAGGGIVSQISVYCAGDGATPTAQIVLWYQGGYWSSGNFTLPSGTRSVGGQAWRTYAIPNIYVPAGATAIGFWSSGNVVWTYESSGITYYQRSASSIINPFTAGGNEGSGYLGAYITYTPGGVAYVNTGTSASPVWTQGVVYANTGTPASPVQTPGAGLYVNTGTSASPIWTPGA